MSHKVNSKTAEKLFQLATEIQKEKPWSYLTERDFFGIKDPNTGAVSVVSTSGGAGRVFAVQVYLPLEGIRFWNRMMTEDQIPEDIYTNQRMLECEFCGLDDLPEEDIDFFHEYGVESDVQGDVAVFRSYRPRYHPWFVEQSEADLLIQALEIYPDFLMHFKSKKRVNYELFTEPDGFPELPVFCLKDDGNAADMKDWTIKKEIFPRVVEEAAAAERDEIFLNRHQSVQRSDVSWEIAIYLIPEPSFEEGDERPHYPAACLCVDPDAELEPSICVESAEVSYTTLMRKTFSEAVGRYGYLPTELLVASDVAVNIFQDLDKSYGITVKKVESLTAVDTIAPALINALSGQMSPDLMEKLSALDFDPDDLDESDKEMMRSLGMDI